MDLITDFVPGTEFDAVRVSVGEGDIRDNFNHIVDPSRDYVRGVALGDTRTQAAEQAVEVSLFQDGLLLIGRSVSVIVQGAVTVATVVITRDCRGVMCPGSGDSPLLASCLGGQCADRRCTVETPEFCPAGTCFSAAECEPHACAQGSCLTGACLYDVSDSTCGPTQRCDAELGCVADVSDAGAPDAGALDAALRDVSMPDVSMPDVPPDLAPLVTPRGCPSPDGDTVFLFDLATPVDLVAGLVGTAEEGGVHVDGMGESPCTGRYFSTPGPAHSRFVVADHPSFHLSEGALDFWARRPPSSGETVGILSRDEIGISVEGQLTLFLDSRDRLVLRGQINDDVSVLLCSVDPIPVDEWMRIGINWGPAGLELYLNGAIQMGDGTTRIFEGEDTCSDATIPFSIAGSVNPFVLGASTHLSAPETDVPTAFPGPGWTYDHFRLSRVQRDYATEL